MRPLRLAALALSMLFVPQFAGATAAPHAAALPFIQDDYARALAEARARKVPLFIESWAPW